MHYIIHSFHNDKNRCLFFLIIPDGSYWKVKDCETNELYNAVLETTGSIGQVFATNYVPDSRPETYLTSYENKLVNYGHLQKFGEQHLNDGITIK